MSTDDFNWLAVYDTGESVTEKDIESYDKLPNKQRIISFSLLHNNTIHEYLRCPEDDYYPVYFRRVTQVSNGREYTMQVIAKIHVNTKQPKEIRFILSNGQTFTTDHWWTDHAYFFEPDALKPQEVKE